MKLVWIPAALLAAASPALAQPAAVLGGDASFCAPGAKGPAALVQVSGLKDRQGEMRIELYPPNQDEFLGDRHKLVDEGKTFRRVIAVLPESGPVDVCVKLPAPGTYALAVIHQRTGTRKFNFSEDGIGFPNNPKLGWSKPDVSKVWVTFGEGVTNVPVTMNYRSGLSMRPLPAKK